MIEYLPASTATCLVVKLEGELHGADYTEFIGKVESAIKEHGSVNLVVSMQDLESADWEAVKADARFGLSEYRKIKRAACVGDQKWAEWFFKLTSPFTRTEERWFQPEQLDQAVQWACM